ncbi:hypothetical protein [Phaeodactylibacter xiamenensis]|uniref:hypothetical protein n=1 Tax=Phaeodactylibacter xiamenensis TaxID=1524460 RepID=UPI001269BAEE|nr:hypothetical protein [Phaeodactylibacter xiamenensis]
MASPGALTLESAGAFIRCAFHAHMSSTPGEGSDFPYLSVWTGQSIRMYIGVSNYVGRSARRAKSHRVH